MESKKYTVRVELGMMVEITVDACHEDNAAAIAENLLKEKLYASGHSDKLFCEVDDPAVEVMNWDVVARDVEEREV